MSRLNGRVTRSLSHIGEMSHSTPGSQVSPVKNNEFCGVCGVSVEGLGGVCGVKHCLDSVWAEGEGFLPVFFIIVS